MAFYFDEKEIEIRNAMARVSMTAQSIQGDYDMVHRDSYTQEKRDTRIRHYRQFYEFAVAFQSDFARRVEALRDVLIEEGALEEKPTGEV